MSEQRKKDHIDLTFTSRPSSRLNTYSLNYEPLFSPHPKEDAQVLNQEFIGYDFKLPLWVSSMTGGTEKAKRINKNLSKACGEFGFGMGLGSCRSLLDSEERLSDFDVKEYMPNMPLYTNFGIAQLEELAESAKLNRIDLVTKKLHADGIIVHVNPLQEWAQAEGDRYKKAPIDTIKNVLDSTQYPVIVKEVGQGFGPKSLLALSSLPLRAIELSGFGGTNFTILEQARLSGANSGKNAPNASFGRVGHTCEEMIDWLNQQDLAEMKCKEFIVSGGITDSLVGHALNESLKYNSVFGMASNLLKYSMGDYEELQDYICRVKENLEMAKAYMRKM